MGFFPANHSHLVPGHMFSIVGVLKSVLLKSYFIIAKNKKGLLPFYSQMPGLLQHIGITHCRNCSKQESALGWSITWMSYNMLISYITNINPPVDWQPDKLSLVHPLAFQP